VKLLDRSPLPGAHGRSRIVVGGSVRRPRIGVAFVDQGVRARRSRPHAPTKTSQTPTSVRISQPWSARRGKTKNRREALARDLLLAVAFASKAHGPGTSVSVDVDHLAAREIVAARVVRPVVVSDARGLSQPPTLPERIRLRSAFRGFRRLASLAFSREGDSLPEGCPSCPSPLERFRAPGGGSRCRRRRRRGGRPTRRAQRRRSRRRPAARYRSCQASPSRPCGSPGVASSRRRRG